MQKFWFLDRSRRGRITEQSLEGGREFIVARSLAASHNPFPRRAFCFVGTRGTGKTQKGNMESDVSSSSFMLALETAALLENHFSFISGGK